ncbi:type IV conjugative transfer system protein TraL [Novosphingobium sp. 9U]|uniref:type IV conjugative transfer system protein TraL n=1 Tax=Novosphingobium sp. 9U TaxID=2653158 RepID=UPI0012F41A76|nr:type IV conjugative transfer system protein TraL [Novosphingobium sp. 9U]VWX49820.1 Type IV conjugative transfer system protein TraL [Novosphingobium sp. 9U]
MDRYAIPKHLDDPELIGFWTLDEFIIMFVPFLWGVLSQHIIIGLVSAIGAWFVYRKAKAGRSISWILHVAYWHLPGSFFGLKVAPPSHVRVMAG